MLSRTLLRTTSSRFGSAANGIRNVTASPLAASIRIAPFSASPSASSSSSITNFNAAASSLIATPFPSSSSSNSHRNTSSSSSTSTLIALGIVSSLFGFGLLSTSVAECVGHDNPLDDDDHHKHPVATKTWSYYSGPGGDLENMRLFTGNSNRELATEIAHYLGIQLSPATVDRFSDGEIKIQVHTNVRQAHCFVVQPTSSPVNDSLMELLFLVSTLRRASAAEITAVIPYYGYCRQDRKLASRVPISAADVAILLEEMGVDRVVAVDLHGGQIQGFFPPSIPVENLESMPIGALYFSEKHLRKPVVVAASAGGVLRAKRFRETLSNQNFDSDMAMLIESREADEAGRFDADSKGKLDLVGTVKGCDCILVEDIVDTATTVQHAAEELKRQGSRNIYAFITHGLFSAPDAASKIENSPIKELVTTNTVHISPEAERVDKITILTLAPLLAETIRRVYQKKSISGLYQKPIVQPASVAEVKAD